LYGESGERGKVQEGEEDLEKVTRKEKERGGWHEWE
jgi:hypothetical protein